MVSNFKGIVKTYRVSIDHYRFKAYQRQKELLFLYGPIVGAQALNLYSHLLMQGGWSQKTPGHSSKRDFSLLLMTANCDQVTFNQLRCLLEAMNLLVTVVEGENYIFYLRPPLEAELFLAHHKYMSLLRDKQPDFNPAQLETNFGLSATPRHSRRQNISVSFSYLFPRSAKVVAGGGIQFSRIDQQLTACNLNPCSY